jgi:hypothetical protein
MYLVTGVCPGIKRALKMLENRQTAEERERK